MTGTNFDCVFVEFFHLTEYCRSVTIVTKNQTTFFTRKIEQFHLKTGQFWHFFEVKNVVNFSNSSRQYSVNVLTVECLTVPLWYKQLVTFSTQNSTKFAQRMALLGPVSDYKGPIILQHSLVNSNAKAKSLLYLRC